MAETLEYKCPCCGGALSFNAGIQKMKCPYCDTEMTIEEFQRTQKSEDIQTDEKKDSIVCTLPPIRLLDNNFIDEAKTKSFFEEGKWTGADRQAMYDRAYVMMKKRCLTPVNYQTARRNAKQQFKDMFKTMGFTNVRIEFED